MTPSKSHKISTSSGRLRRGSTTLKVFLSILIVGSPMVVGWSKLERSEPVLPKAAPAPTVVPEKLKEAAPVPAPPKEKEPAPPLPQLLSLEKSDALQALKEATLKCIADGRWAEHKKVVTEASLSALSTRARGDSGSVLDGPTRSGGLPLGLAQLAIIRRIGLAETAAFTKEFPEFAGRIFTSPEITELFLNCLTEQDVPDRVLRVWRRLDAIEERSEDKVHYRNLALAVALVYDTKKAKGDETDEAVYRYYRFADKAHRLYVNVTKMSPDLLTWAVGGGAFGLTDYEWALKNVNFPHARLDGAYPSIKYMMNHDPYPMYDMKTVMKMGGICGNQSDYALGNAQARGVPSAKIVGDGSRGAHAWFAFLSPRGWTMKTGRYEDGYACGSTVSPQTGLHTREWDLLLYDNPARRNGDRVAAMRLLRASVLLGESGDSAGEESLLVAATDRDSREPVLWAARFAALARSKTPRSADFWEKLIVKFRMEMKEHPDFYHLSDSIEKEFYFPKLNPDRIGEMLRKRRRGAFRDNPGRFDLLVRSVADEAEYYAKVGDKHRIALTYKAAFREYGSNLPTYLGLAQDIVVRSKDVPELLTETLTTMESIFTSKVDSHLKGDAFALEMEAKVAFRLAELMKRAGESRKADRYKARGEEIATLSKKKLKEMD